MKLTARQWELLEAVERGDVTWRRYWRTFRASDWSTGGTNRTAAMKRLTADRLVRRESSARVTGNYVLTDAGKTALAERRAGK